jgi:hypothetical protein
MRRYALCCGVQKTFEIAHGANMKVTLNIVGAFMLLFGTVWFLQNIVKVLGRPASGGVGDVPWRG